MDSRPGVSFVPCSQHGALFDLPVRHQLEQLVDPQPRARGPPEFPYVATALAAPYRRPAGNKTCLEALLAPVRNGAAGVDERSIPRPQRSCVPTSSMMRSFKKFMAPEIMYGLFTI